MWPCWTLTLPVPLGRVLRSPYLRCQLSLPSVALHLGLRGQGFGAPPFPAWCGSSGLGLTVCCFCFSGSFSRSSGFTASSDTQRLGSLVRTLLSTWVSLPSCGITTRRLVSVDGHRTPDLEGRSCILLTLLPGMYTQVEWAAPRVATRLEIF